MTDYNRSLAHLIVAIEHHSSVKAYKDSEKRLKDLSQLSRSSFEMKKYQQDAVLFDKIGKARAASETSGLAKEIENQINEQPIVADFREKMQDASDLIQYVTKSIEEKINKEIKNGRF